MFKFVMQFLSYGWGSFFCRHPRKTWIRRVDDYNLRSGLEHKSSVYHCPDCGRHVTIEEL